VLQVVEGSRTYGSPSCVTRPAAAFVRFMNAMKITEYCRRFGIKPVVILRVRLATLSTTVVAVCTEGFGTPQLDPL
jgi:hypothetical protein